MNNIVIINGKVYAGKMDMIQGNGNVLTQELTSISPESDIQTLLAEGAISLILDISHEHEGKSSMSVKAEENILPLIDIRQVNNTVMISGKGNYSSNTTPLITLHCAGLQKLCLSGASSAFGEVLQHKFNIDVSGSSKVLLKGEVEQVQIDASGASEVDVEHLFSQKAFIDVSGASKVSVWVEKDVVLDASGASKVKVYTEEAKMQKNTSGVASVSTSHKAVLLKTQQNNAQSSIVSVNESETITPQKPEEDSQSKAQGKTINFKKFI